MFFFGFLFGVALLGGVSDKRGRRLTFLVSLLILQVFAGVAFAAPNYWVYALARFGIGFGVGGLGMVSFVWNAEVMTGSHRSITTATGNGSFALGVMILSPMYLELVHWRKLSLALFI